MVFEPKILGFLCNWCSYAGADLAGVSRIQYPPNVRVIRVMCSGRVDPKFIFKALMQGLDGVIVLGCHPGDCHYLEGNYEEEKKFEMVIALLKEAGFETRVKLDWVSASEGTRFGEIITSFVEDIRTQGPTPINNGGTESNHLMKKIKAMEMAAGSERLRALSGRKRKVTEVENVYGEKIPRDKFDAIFYPAIHDEYVRARIRIVLDEGSKSVSMLAEELGVEKSIILEHLVSLKGSNIITFDKIVGLTPMYMNIGG